MAKDERIWARFVVDMPDNPKILPLSDAAFRCLIEATMYSRRLMTDGFLASRLALAKWGPEALQELCANDAEKPSLVEVEGGYLIRDFAEHQETRAEIEKRRERLRANGRKGGLAKAKQVGKQPAKQKSSQPVAETETETVREVAKATSTRTARGSRITHDWMPSQELINQMRQECPTVDLEAEHKVFIDYFLGAPGSKGVKLDWPATWRNWMRRKQNEAPRRYPTQSSSKSEAALSFVQRLEAEDAARRSGQAPDGDRELRQPEA